MQTLSLAHVSEPEATGFLARVQAGELDAIAQVYDQHHRALCVFAARLLGDDAAAEDLVHDVFVVLPRVVHKYNTDKSLRGFLLGIATNRARHHIRAAVRRRNMVERLSREPHEVSPTPEQHAERVRLARLLARGLDRLSLDQRMAFVLCEIEGHNQRDAAEILKVPEATLRTRLFYARQKLRGFLAKEGPA